MGLSGGAADGPRRGDEAADPAGPPVDLARLRRLLGTPETEWLLGRVRARMARDQALTGTVTRTQASDDERAAVQRLLGRAPRQGRSLSVPLEGVDDALRRSGVSPGGLAAAVVALKGPVRSRAAAESAEARAWDAAFAPLIETCAGRPELAAWCEGVRAGGLVRRLAPLPAAAPLLHSTAAVLAELPADPVALSAFAARVAGDAHALDDGRPLATLVLGAARALTGTPAGSGAQWRRELWSAVGLLKDDLSSTVLAFGLPGDDRTGTGRVLSVLRATGQPAVLTLRQLVGDPPHPPPAGTVIRICENPAVVSAAAERLGASCPPLVCVQGQPGAAALGLLRGLAEGGALLRYHGDFDWGGIRIAATLGRSVPWRPWRFTADDYAAAADTGNGNPLVGVPTVADWDPRLSAAMERTGVRVEEEAVLDLLLDDLARAAATV